MADSKKKSSSPAKKQTQARRRNAVPQSPPKTTVKHKKEAPPPQKPVNNQVRSVLICALGVFVLIVAVYPGTRGWLALHNLLLGVFGIGVYIVPFVLMYTGYLIGKDQSKQASKKAIYGLLLALLCSTLVQVYAGDSLANDIETGEKLTLGESIALLYKNGVEMHGGGLIAAITALPLIRFFDVVGARIIVTLLAVVLVMLLTNRSLGEMLRILTRPFSWIGHGVVDAATKGIEGIREDFYGDEMYDEEEEYDEEEDEEPKKYVRGSRRKELPEPEEPEPEELPEEQPQTARKARRQADKQMKEVAYILGDGSGSRANSRTRNSFSNVDLDVPIVGSNAEVPKEEVNALSEDTGSGADGFKMTLEEEAEFQAMVEHAAQESDRMTNRLPWATDPAEEEDEEDESVYEEEPEIPYIQPPLSLLHQADNSANDADKSAELREKGKQLVETLASFGVSVRITGIRRGPTVTRYEIQPAAGVKIAKITALADDIGLNLGGTSVRISQVEGKPALGVEVPNNTKDTVSLREILESTEFQESQSRLTFAIGKDIDGNVILGDIAKMPHMIIAGTTGSGKSVCTNSIIMSILFHASPDEVRLLLVDPKVVEFQPYDGVPHLLIPVVTQPQKAAGALNWAVIEMERRYALCAQYGVRDLKGYNAVAEKNPELKKLPQILIIIDEFADLMMMSSNKEVETSVIRIAQKARAAGLHLVIATQRPTADVITGLIKSNVPSRIGMSVKSSRDSLNILDCTGAETLLGNGDLLFYPNGMREPKRVQGCFVSDSEVEAVTSFLKSGGTAEYDEEIMDAVEKNTPVNKNETSSTPEETGELTGEMAVLVQAAELAVDMGQISTTALQRRLKLGYAKAARIVDEMEQRGIVGPSEGAKPRKVLMSPQDLTAWKLTLAAQTSPTANPVNG